MDSVKTGCEHGMCLQIGLVKIGNWKRVLFSTVGFKLLRNTCRPQKLLRMDY